MYFGDLQIQYMLFEYMYFEYMYLWYHIFVLVLCIHISYFHGHDTPTPLPPPTMVTATATALATTTKFEGDVWVTWQLLAVARKDGWWWQISSSLSADFFNPFLPRGSSKGPLQYFTSDIHTLVCTQRQCFPTQEPAHSKWLKMKLLH
jgi:hypothetical protein